MRIGSLFSGIGGLELGLEWAGLGPVIWQVEQDEFCLRVLARHWPEVERYNNVREAGAANLPPVDLICGGFPCQDISQASAGKGAGLAGDRSGLWHQFARIVGALRPPWVVVENVASGSAHWVDDVCNQLGGLGYEALPIPLSAEDVGAPHERERIFIIARDAHRDREPMGAEHEKVARVPRATGTVPGWPEPPSVSVDDGFPGGMAAYGNAVVPQCAEVIGWIVRELEGAG